MSEPVVIPGAAINTLFAACDLFSIDLVILEEGDTEADLDPFSGDTAHWAIWPYAGAEWDEKSDPQRRGEFWHWWLAEAVPQAWASEKTSFVRLPLWKGV